MFRIASGDPWPDSLPILGEDGSIDYRTCLYMCSFIVIVCWVAPRPAAGGFARGPRTRVSPAADATAGCECPIGGPPDPGHGDGPGRRRTLHRSAARRSGPAAESRSR